MRLSSADMNLRVSSSVDQITCFTPAALAASAMFLACWISFSAEKCSQKLVTPNTPCAPANAFFRLSTLSRSALTTSAPAAASAFALSLLVSRVMARSGKPAVRIGQNRAREPAALSPGCTHYCNDLLSAISSLLFKSVNPDNMHLNLHSRHFLADDRRALGERVELHLGHHARQRLHAAVGAQRDLVGRHGA